jgi:hypothetical protein
MAVLISVSDIVVKVPAAPAKSTEGPDSADVGRIDLGAEVRRDRTSNRLHANNRRFAFKGRLDDAVGAEIGGRKGPRSTVMKLISLSTATALLLGPLAGLYGQDRASTRSDSIRLDASPGLSTAAEILPADGFYPRGRKMVFAGYSGKPERDLAHGFTVAGPFYGNQGPPLEQCFSNGWPVIAHVGVRGGFTDKHPVKYKVDEPTLRQDIETQVKALSDRKEIIWWGVRPEELRPWVGEEMNYLAIVTDTIRRTDPQRRPIFHYNPNHRNAGSLGPIARYVDVLAKGCYVNYTGRKRNRAWIRWSVEQEIDAIRATGRSDMIPIVMPEFFRDPEPDEDEEIRAWVRHDVYLGLASGAKGVIVYSLFNRAMVARSWRLWYDAYAECGRELNGGRGLAQVFLFGERRSDLVVKLVRGESVTKVTLGGKAETSTTTAKERAERETDVPAWTAVEYAFGQDRWLFVVNSGNSPAAVTVAGWAKGTRASNAFDDSPIHLGDDRPWLLELPAYGVAGTRFRKSM